MFVYEKKLQYPVKIKNSNPKLASVIISQYGGPDGELGASLRYLSQRYAMPWPELKAILTISIQMWALRSWATWRW
jgi:spore coat protein JC